MRVKWPVAGAAFVGAAAVLSYVTNSQPSPDPGIVLGLVVVTALVILIVLLAGWAVNRPPTRS